MLAEWGDSWEIWFMKTPRLLVPDSMDGLYHVVSRVVDRRMVFGEEEKRRFRELLLAYAGFSGIEVVAWCLMDNHFHLLLLVPGKAEHNPRELPESEVLRRVGLIYGQPGVKEAESLMAMCQTPESRRSILERYTKRMGDMGLMMKSIKQRFSSWFNRRADRSGTLWEDRYKSVIIQGDGDDEGTLGHVARIVAAYIDLNPIRAGVVRDPKDYPWSGYGMAERGELSSRQGLLRLWGPQKDIAMALARHRVFIFEEGSEERIEESPVGNDPAPEASGRRGSRAGIDIARVRETQRQGGRLPVSSLLRIKSRDLVDGGIIGSEAFLARALGKSVEDSFQQLRDASEPSGSPVMVGAEPTGSRGPCEEWEGLRVFRSQRAQK